MPRSKRTHKRSYSVKYLNYEGRCSVCQRSAVEPKLHKDIINSKKFFPSDKSALTLTMIADKYDIFYNSIVRHVKNHLTISAEDILEIEMKRIDDRARAQQQLEDARLAVKVSASLNPSAITTSPNTVWDEVIDKAREGVIDGTIKLTANHLLKAAKDKSDYEIKKKNQDIAIQEMMWHFASGEALGSGNYDRKIIEGEEATDYNAAEVFAGHLSEGEDGSSDLHTGTPGDATPSWADQILEGDDF